MDNGRLDLVGILYKHLTPVQQNFANCYIKHKGDVKKVCKEMGYSAVNFGRLYKMELMQDYFKALKESTGSAIITVNPTFEWIQQELMGLYKTAVDEEDQDGAQRLLKNITDFRAKFGKFMDEDSAKIGRMSKKELLEFITTEYNRLKGELKEKLWYEKSREAFKYEAEDEGE